MALSRLRLRGALSHSSYLTKPHIPSSPFPPTSALPPLSFAPTITPQNPSLNNLKPTHFPSLSRLFRSTSLSLYDTDVDNKEDKDDTLFTDADEDEDEVGTDDEDEDGVDDDEVFWPDDEEEFGQDKVEFVVCDYSHWLIVMDFCKNPAPTRVEMVDTYIQTLAKVVGSYAEAKKRMYAFSTTTYQGFQCRVTEEMSEKFKGLPGVMFVLPDSYSDPVKSEDGGGVIAHRPPLVQFGRPGQRYNDPNQQHGSSIGDQQPMFWDARNFKRPPGAGDRRVLILSNDASRVRDPTPSYQAAYNKMSKDIITPKAEDFHQSKGIPELTTKIMHLHTVQHTGMERVGVMVKQLMVIMDRVEESMNKDQGFCTAKEDEQIIYKQHREIMDKVEEGIMGKLQAGIMDRGRFPPAQRDSRVDNENYAPPHGPTYRHGTGGSYGQTADGNYRQGGGIYEQGPGFLYSQGQGTNYRQAAQGNYGQGAGGSYGQGAAVHHGQGFGANHGQEMGFGYGGNRDECGFEKRNTMQGEEGTYAPMAHTRQTNGRFPPEQRDSIVDNKSYAHPQGPSYGHGSGGSYGQMADGNYGQGGGIHGQGAGFDYSQGGGTNYRQEAQGYYGQGAGGNYGQGAGGNYGQGVGANHGQQMGFGYRGSREEHRFEQSNNMQGEQGTYALMACTGQTKVEESMDKEQGLITAKEEEQIIDKQHREIMDKVQAGIMDMELVQITGNKWDLVTGGSREEHRFEQSNNMQGEQETSAPLALTGQTNDSCSYTTLKEVMDFPTCSISYKRNFEIE
ncbi:hypothetical protein RHSIM_Rhsim03G0007900 [Rhododendron simsii]|uniref:MORF/ORRM1/DAG-like MORF domain-containing protein n=1 Tax=Rhododendron simsii TaxID=118357 RepID=A0A834H6S3_RHOSS|nr:hypothetical protein RHSIM_Rhsim03G0007900 [Rhododendron simsii]